MDHDAAGRAGLVIFGAIKQVIGLFLAVYIANVADGASVANEPVHQFLETWYGFLPGWLAMALAVVLVVISQVKINVTNAYPVCSRGRTARSG